MLTTDAASLSKRFSNVDDDLTVVLDAFSLGEVQECRFLPAGLMNGNWRLATTAGVFALKRIVDVPLPLARRNLAVLAELADADAPVSRPWATRTGETVEEIEDRGYCLIPWTEGAHITGTALTVEQATDLGAMLGEIHRHLNSERMFHLLPPAPRQTTARVTSPDNARAEADRFLARIAGLENPTEFDDEAAAALSLRKVLLDKYGHDRPRSE
ncbi:MAG: phosphotransferase, partial [Pseudonocardiaceae bacterium]